MNRPGITQFDSGHPGVGAPTEQDRARSALRHIDPDCPYDEWVRIGMAAQAAGLAFEDFHNWSAAAGNYAGEHDCRTKWKSFDARGGVTAATIFKAARDQGWHDLALGAKRTMNVPVAKQKHVPAKPATKTENLQAVHVWELCDPAPVDHAYIVKKGGAPAALRVYPATAPDLIIRDKDGPHSVAGWLVVPCMADGRLQTLQLISCDGRKLNLPGASFNDGFFVVGQITAADVIYTVEGLGQAWAMHAATGAPAVVTFGADRMAAVAAALRTLKPAARMVIVPDRGKENQAQAIAAKVNCVGASCRQTSRTTTTRTITCWSIVPRHLGCWCRPPRQRRCASACCPAAICPTCRPCAGWSAAFCRSKALRRCMGRAAPASPFWCSTLRRQWQEVSMTGLVAGLRSAR